MSEETLKPCPFCGKESYMGKTGYVGCANGDTYMAGKRLYNTCPIAGDAMTREQWNSRPIEDALRAQIDSLQELLTQSEKASDKTRIAELEAALNDIQCLSPAAAYTLPDSKVVELDYSDYCDYCQKIKELTEVALKKKAGE